MRQKLKRITVRQHPHSLEFRINCFAETRRIAALAFTELTDYGLAWALWLSGIGLGVLGCALLLLQLITRQDVAAFFRRTMLRAPSLRGRLLVGFCVVGMIPVLTLPPLLAVSGASALQKQLFSQVENSVRSMAAQLAAPIDRQVDDIATLAEHINASEATLGPDLTEWLLRYHNRRPEYVSIWIASPNGDIAAATARLEGAEQPGAIAWSGPIAGVAQTDYFQEAIAQDGAYASSVRKGVSAGNHPTMFVSAPLGKPGAAPWGYLQAQLDVDKLIGERFRAGTLPDTFALLINAEGQVIMRSNSMMFLPFENISAHPLMSALQDQSGGVTQGRAYPFTGMVEQTGEAGSYLAAAQSIDHGWRVISIVPTSGVMGVVLIPLALSLVWAFIVFFLARGLARLYSGSVSDPLRQLDESLSLFDSEPTMRVIPLAPDQAPAEIQEVYHRVRESMRRSLDSYRNMLKALRDGEELRHKLRKLGGNYNRDDADLIVVEEEKNPTGVKAGAASFNGRLDSVTELPGRELFIEYFREAWALGTAEGRPLTLLLVRVDTADDEQLKVAALALARTAGRGIDLVARTDATHFSIVLPDTDCNGGLAVGDRALASLQEDLKKAGGGVPCMNIAIASILPKANGNVDAFIKATERVMAAAQKKGDGRTAYVDSKGKIVVKDLRDPDSVDWDMEEAS